MITIFDIQNINSLLKNNNFNYNIKLKDVCGSQSITLECTGEEKNIQDILDIINEYLKNNHVYLTPGTINPNNLIINKR